MHCRRLPVAPDPGASRPRRGVQPPAGPTGGSRARGAPDSLDAFIDALDLDDQLLFGTGDQSAVELLGEEADEPTDDQLAAAQAIAWWQCSRGFDLEDIDGAFGSYSEGVARAAAQARSRDKLVAEVERFGWVVHLAPYDNDTTDLLRAGCALAGVPLEWADSEGMHVIGNRESAWQRSRPNYTYNDEPQYKALRPAPEVPVFRLANRIVWERIIADLQQGIMQSGPNESSATGFYQLLLSNVRRFYPFGVEFMGSAIAQVVGGLLYVRSRYLTPENALRFYDLPHWPGKKSDRPPTCVYSWRALPEYGGCGYKPGEGY